MKHLDSIERFVNLVEKVSNLYDITITQAHSYVINYLKENTELDKEGLNNSGSTRTPEPETNEELAEYVANRIRISTEDMLTIIEGIENGYNLNDNPIYAIAFRDKIINSLKDNISKEVAVDISYYADLTFKDFSEKLAEVGLSLCWDVNKEMISIGKREFANPMLWFDPRVEEKDYSGSVQFKPINTALFSKKQVYTALRLVNSLLLTDLEKREI